jgi:hypothetical protein
MQDLFWVNSLSFFCLQKQKAAQAQTTCSLQLDSSLNRNRTHFR